jgi:ribonuclease BN (tRNA processing enzyme)
VAELTIVGCSGSVPGPDSAASCYLVERAGHRLLLEIGTGAAGPLQRYAEPAAVDAAFISHSHGDHAGDLWALLYLRQRAGRMEPFPVYATSVADTLAAEVALTPVPAEVGPWTARSAEVDHIPGSLAIRLDDRLCFTGDTAPCEALDDLAHGCRVLLAEAAQFDAARGPGHLSAGDAGRLAARSGAQLLILTHLRAWHDHSELLAEAAAEASCPVLLATPGLRIAL